ncbi:MAG: OmpA family protein [Bacteroidota bacterium]
MKTILSLFLGLTLSGLCLAQEQQRFQVHFASDESEVKSFEEDRLDSLFSQLDVSAITEVLLVGHTDADGTEAYNLRLSLKRLNVIEAFLSDKGVADTVIQLVPMGESQPLASNLSTEGRRQNRRVDIRITMSMPLVEASPQPSIAELYELIRPESDIFWIDPRKDTLLQAEEGTILFIPKNSFNGDGKVKIVLKERLKLSEMIQENLTTVTPDGQIMASEGMLHLAAFRDGEPIELEQKITVMTPTNNPREDVQFYQGFYAADSSVLWNATPIASVSMPWDWFCCWAYNSMGYWENDKCGFFCRFGRMFTPKARRKPLRRWVSTSTLPCLGTETIRSYSQAEIDSIKLANLQAMFPGMSPEALEKIKNPSTAYYLTQANLGWGNWDWMMKVQDKVQFAVNESWNASTAIKVIFPKQKSIVPLSNWKEVYAFQNMPNNIPARLLGLRNTDSGPMIAMEKIRTSKKRREALSFTTCSENELIKKLGKLDKLLSYNRR